MTTAMHGRADTSAQGAHGDERVIDLSTTTPQPPPPFVEAESVPVIAPVTADELAHMAAEVAVSVARHREELAAAMAELTALQRTLRSEVRAVIAELDRIAAGVAPDPVTGTVTGTQPTEISGSSTSEAASKWSISNPLRRTR